MGLKKTTSTTTDAPVPTTSTPSVNASVPAAVESGVAAATSRLKKSTEAAGAKQSTGRDYNEEARGKTRCAQFEAALMSPALAGMKFDTMEQYLALCKQAADFGTAYTFGDKQ